MAKHVRIEGLTDRRQYGVVCEKHPELNGLRQKDVTLRYVKRSGEVVKYTAQGKCVGCSREKDRNRRSGKLHYGGNGWQGLTAAFTQMRGA